MSNWFCLAHCYIALSGKTPKTDQCWDLFKINNTECTADFSVTVFSDIIYKYGLDILPSQPGPSYFLCESCLVSANSDWSSVSITLLDGKDTGLMGALSASLMTHLSIRSGLLAHASLVSVGGSGIMFLGPSGIGKTTQAELWARYKSALIINGDMVFVAYRSGAYRGYGSPWHGSSPYCENASVPLSALVILEQSSVNSLELLTGISCVSRVMSNVFLPHWYRPGVDGVCSTLDGLLSSVPVYLLKCRPDQEAVDILASALNL